MYVDLIGFNYVLTFEYKTFFAALYGYLPMILICDICLYLIALSFWYIELLVGLVIKEPAWALP